MYQRRADLKHPAYLKFSQSEDPEYARKFENWVGAVIGRYEDLYGSGQRLFVEWPRSYYLGGPILTSETLGLDLLGEEQIVGMLEMHIGRAEQLEKKCQ